MMPFKRLLLLIFILLSTINLNALAPKENLSPQQLEAQMQQFHHRVRIYLKCLRGTCTMQERDAAKKAAIDDGYVLVGALSVLIVLGTWLSVGGLIWLNKPKPVILSSKFQNTEKAFNKVYNEFTQITDDGEKLDKYKIVLQEFTILQNMYHEAQQKYENLMNETNKTLEKLKQIKKEHPNSPTIKALEENARDAYTKATDTYNIAAAMYKKVKDAQIKQNAAHKEASISYNAYCEKSTKECAEIKAHLDEWLKEDFLKNPAEWQALQEIIAEDMPGFSIKKNMGWE